VSAADCTPPAVACRHDGRTLDADPRLLRCPDCQAWGVRVGKLKVRPFLVYQRRRKRSRYPAGRPRLFESKAARNRAWVIGQSAKRLAERNHWTPAALERYPRQLPKTCPCCRQAWPKATNKPESSSVTRGEP
jgi:hypothetical protein